MGRARIYRLNPVDDQGETPVFPVQRTATPVSRIVRAVPTPPEAEEEAEAQRLAYGLPTEAEGKAEPE